MEPSTESILSYDEVLEAITEGQNIVKLDPDLQEGFHGLMEKIKCEETIIPGKFEQIDIKPVISLEKYEVPSSEQSLEFSEIKLELIDDTLSPSLCRLCATQGNALVQMIGQNGIHEDIMEKIEYCLPAVVMNTDTLPKHACQLCLEKLELCYQFHKTVAAAQKKLLTIFDDQVSGKTKGTKEYCQAFPLCSNEGGGTKHVNNEEELEISSEEDANTEEFTTVSEELRETDAVLENNIMLSNSNLHSNELFPAMICSTNMLYKDSITRSSNDEHENADSSMDDNLNSDRTSPSEIKQGTWYSVPNSPTRPVDLEKGVISDETFSSLQMHSPPSSKIRESCNSPTQECGENENKKNDVLFCGEVIKYKTVSGQSNRCAQTCRVCGLALPTAEICHIHAGIHALPNYFPCSFCEETFKTETNWKEHSLKHTGVKKLKKRTVSQNSNVSAKNFVTQLKLNFNKVYHKSSANPCYCKKCDKVMDSEMLLNWHKLTVHTEHKESCCKKCGTQFRTKEQLNIHQSNDCRPPPIKKSYTCWHCGKTYIRKGDLVGHMRKHTGERPYNCDYCTKTFAIRANREQHHKMHRRKRTFTCFVCKSTFLSSKELKRHATVHSSETPYQCEMCGIRFTANSSLHRHMRAQHGKIGHKY